MMPEDGAYYAARAFEDDEAVRVGWRDQVAQQRRFSALARIFPAPPTTAFSVNDVGCGLGAFADFLVQSGYANARYTGIDHSDAMIAEAKVLHREHPDRAFRVAPVRGLEPADFSVASGIFNLRQSSSDEAWLQFIYDGLEQINAASTRGFAFNALTRYSDPPRMQSELYYADPCTLFDHCKRTFSRNVALLHDYDEYDFTIIVRKAE
jgi:SAM-dependent methyltransferase